MGKQSVDDLYSNVEIRPSENGFGTEVYVDGQELEDVRSYRIEHSANKPPIIILEINALKVSIKEPKCLLKIKGHEDKIAKITFIDESQIEHP